VTAARSRRPVVRGLFDRLPFADATIDCVVSADVLCHENIAPSAALREARRCLRPGGVLVLNLPAYPWLLSYHDERVQNARRFTVKGTRALLEHAGLRLVYATYWNTLLFPIMVLQRLVPRASERESDVHLYPRPIEAAFGALLACERALLRVGARLPFGGSILAVARRADG